MRQYILDQPKRLTPAQFEEAVFQYGMPPDLLRREVALRQQILDLIQYALRLTTEYLPDLPAAVLTVVLLKVWQTYRDARHHSVANAHE